MNQSQLNGPKDTREVALFEISLINQQNQPLIRPLYSGFETLRSLCEKNFAKNVKNMSGHLNYKDQKMYPLIWIDYRSKQKSQSLQPTTFLYELFNQILSEPTTKSSSTRSQTTRSDKIESSLKKQFPCSSPKSQHQSHQKHTKKNPDFFITSKILQAKVNNPQQTQNQIQNILLIHLTLFVHVKEFQTLTQNIMSMSCFMAQDLILNCSSLDGNQINHITSVIKSQEDTKVSRKNKIKLHLITGYQNQTVIQNKDRIHSYPLKDIRNSKKVIGMLHKIRQNFLQELSLRCFSQDQMTLTAFINKCQIAARIVESQSKKTKPSLSELFSPQRITEVSEELSKQSRFSQTQTIRQKFERFYNSLSGLNKKAQLPLPIPIIKYRIEQVIQKELKGVTSKPLIHKIAAQYEKKILQKNQFEIQKLLVSSMAQYLSSSFQLNFASSKQSKNCSLHPQSTSLQIVQFYHIMQSTHIFISQTQLNKYIYPKIWLEYYKKLYEEYVKTKRSMSGSQVKNQEVIEELKLEVQNLKNKKNEAEKDIEVKKQYWGSLDKQSKENQSQIKKLKNQIIQWKEKYQSNNMQLLNQINITKQLQKTIKQLKLAPSHQQKPHQSNQTTKSDHIQRLKYSILQEFASQSDRESQTLTKSFQYQLNIYKDQYQKQEKQLKEKSDLLQQKETFYKEKVYLLEQQLGQFKSSSHVLMQTQMENALWKEVVRKQLETDYQEKIASLRRQTDEKLDKYKLHIKELQKIRDDKNDHISRLGEQVYKSRKQAFILEEKLDESEKKLREKDRHINELVRLVEQKNNQLNAKIKDSIQLTQKLKEKNIKLELLQQDIKQLRQQLAKQQSDSPSVGLSFLKFEKDFIEPPSIQKPLPQKIVSPNVMFQSQQTPLKRTSRVKTVCQIKENMQLQRLIEQRRTIEKKKQKCSKRQQLLQEMEGRLVGARSEMKISKKNSSIIEGSAPYQKTQQTHMVLKQSNKLFSKYPDDSSFQALNKISQCRKKLF